MSELSVSAFRQGCEYLKMIGIIHDGHNLYITEKQLDLMITQGEIVDKDRQTINGIKYFIHHSHTSKKQS